MLVGLKNKKIKIIVIKNLLFVGISGIVIEVVRVGEFAIVGREVVGDVLLIGVDGTQVLDAPDGQAGAPRVDGHDVADVGGQQERVGVRQMDAAGVRRHHSPRLELVDQQTAA